MRWNANSGVTKPKLPPTNTQGRGRRDDSDGAIHTDLDHVHQQNPLGIPLLPNLRGETPKQGGEGVNVGWG